MDISLKTISNPNSIECQSSLSYDTMVLMVIMMSSIGLLWSIYNYLMVRRIDVMQEMQNGDGETQEPLNDANQQQNKILLQLSYKISDGCIQFIKYQYASCLVLIAVFFIIITFSKTKGLQTAIAFLVGAFISILTGVASIIIAAQSHYRIKYCTKFGLAPSFRTAFRASCAIAFGASSLGLLSLMVLIDVTKQSLSLQISSQDKNYYKQFFQIIIGYGFGTSLVAFFGRIGGSIYHKSFQLGADLVGKIQKGVVYHSPSNMATIGQEVGNNTNQILGSVADLFGSFSQSVCAALLLSNSLIGYQSQAQSCNIFLSNLLYPLLLFSFTIIIGLFVSLILINISWLQHHENVTKSLRSQFLISSIIMIGFSFLAAFLAYPSQFKIANLYESYYDIQQPWMPYLCTIIGIIISIIIHLYTQFVTSPSFFPTQSVAQACKSGSTASITLGLALGYMSTAIPIIVICIGSYFSIRLLGFYGIALVAIGCLINYPILLVLNIYSGLGQTANQMANMTKSSQQQKSYIKCINTAGRESLVRSKNASIYIANFVALSLFGGFLYNSQLYSLIAQNQISLTEPQIFTGILLGAMIPFVFSGSIIRSIRRVSQQIVLYVQNQYAQNEAILSGQAQPNFVQCVGVGSFQTLKKLISPFFMIFIICFILGFAIGPKILAGYLIGLIVSSLQLGISGTNSGGSWQSAKSLFENGAILDQADQMIPINSPSHKASIQGFIIGSTLKDASCCSLNVLVKLSSIICLIFAQNFLLVRS